VFDHDNARAVVDQGVEGREKFIDVFEMKPVVGSSKMKRVFALVDCVRCDASFTR
jgi:hypothetical protein